MKKAYITVYALIIALLLFTTIAFLLNGAELMVHSNHYKQKNMQLRLDTESDAIEIISQIDAINDAIISQKFGRHTISSVRKNAIAYDLYRVSTDRKRLTYDTYAKFYTRDDHMKITGIISFQPKYNFEKNTWTEEEMEQFIERGVKENNRDELIIIDYPSVIYCKGKTMYVAKKETFEKLREKLIEEHRKKYENNTPKEEIPPISSHTSVFTSTLSALETEPPDVSTDEFSEPEDTSPPLEFPDIEEAEKPYEPELPDYADDLSEEDPIPPYEDDYDRMITETLDGEPVFSGWSALIITEDVEFLGEENTFRGILFDTGQVLCENPISVEGILFVTTPSTTYQLRKGKCISTGDYELIAKDDYSSVMAMMKAYDEVKYHTLSIQ